MKKVLFFGLFLLLLASFGNEGWVKWYQLRSYEKSLQGQNQKIHQDNLRLLQEIKALKDSKYLEHYIREDLGYVRGDEISYEITASFNGKSLE